MSADRPTFVKTALSDREARWEAAGLAWLADAAAVRIVPVREVRGSHLILTEIASYDASREAAQRFGADLARLHDAGAPAFGALPPGWSGDGYLGPRDDLLPLPAGDHATWGAHYAQVCEATAQVAASRGRLPTALRADLDRLCERLRDGVYDDDDAPARLHGDLWAGNVVWSAEGAVLIDPAAHGGHRETDLAMLALFGFPHLDTVRAAYESHHPLMSGWQDRIALHQLHPLLVHLACFGHGYAAQTQRAVRASL